MLYIFQVYCRYMETQFLVCSCVFALIGVPSEPLPWVIALSACLELHWNVMFVWRFCLESPWNVMFVWGLSWVTLKCDVCVRLIEICEAYWNVMFFLSSPWNCDVCVRLLPWTLGCFLPHTIKRQGISSMRGCDCRLSLLASTTNL